MEHRAIEFNRVNVGAARGEIPLGGLRVFQTVGSTNDEALGWAEDGAPDLSLVVADAQTAGRGRSGRTWSTPSASALALSLILRQGAVETTRMGRLSGLGALAVADACANLGLAASIKWPNDVLLRNKKVAGILVEAHWNGDAPDSAVVGIGINVLVASVPPIESIRYPATCIEACLDRVPDRLQVLRLVVSALVDWRGRLGEDRFMKAWAARLAFQGQEVILSSAGAQPIQGRLDGLEEDGGLRLITRRGVEHFPMGELHLAADDTMR